MRHTATIIVGNSYLRIKDYHQEFWQRVVMPFCRKHLNKYGKIPVAHTNKTQIVVTHTFARSNNDKTEFRISKGLLSEFITFAGYCGYKDARFDMREEPVITPVKVNFEWAEGWGEPRELNGISQKEWCDYQLADGPIKVNNNSMGVGKAQPLDCLIKVPNGWKKMGSMKVGDDIITDAGNIAKVINVFPQGVTDVYQMVFKDGRKTKAAGNHLWKVYDPKLCEWVILDTLACIARNKKLSETNQRLSIPLLKSENNVDVKLPISPYLYGRHITWGNKNNNINQKFLNSSSKQRLELLTAIMDFGGNVLSGGSVYHRCSRLIISNLVVDLVRSLGGKARLIRVTSSLYEVDITYPDPYELFSDLYKRIEVIKLTKHLLFDDTLELMNIIKLPNAHTQCIMINDDDHLYVTDEYVVTHNTFMATHSMVNIGERTIITALPKYTTVWLNSLSTSLNLGPDDLVVCDRGGIEDLADNIANGTINPKIILMPLTRYTSYLKRGRVEDLPNLDEQFSKMGIGLRIADEAHESIHQVYISMLFGNFKKFIGLSATLEADDELTNRVYSWVYPKAIRFKEPEKPKYIKIVAYHHRIDLRKYRIKSQGFGGYSHISFETSIRKSPKIMNHYYELVKDCFDTFYIQEYLDKQKCLLFFATVEMCRIITERLQRDYPGLDIVKFTGEESKLNPDAYREHDITVTTPKSCGTGKDIPYLAVVISPYCVSSMQLNDQMKGRLRPIDKWWEGVDPVYVYFVCDDIPKQRDYHMKRRALFDSGSKSMHNYNSNKYLM